MQIAGGILQFIFLIVAFHINEITNSNRDYFN